jgi:beta-glucosidase
MLARLLPLLLLLLLLAAASNACDCAGGQPPISSRRSFPEGFIFGTASAAYQVVTDSSLSRS